MLMDPLNTHTYDSQLAINLIPGLTEMKEMNIEDKKIRGQELLDAAPDMNAISKLFLTQIIASMGSPANIDASNGLIADDLLSICWIYRENPKFILELDIQLQDMITGFCPQGRTHRLFQLLLAFND